MRASSRKFDIPPRKRSFNEENIRIPRKFDDRGTIGRGVGDIGDVGDLLARSDRKEIAQAAKRHDAATRSSSAIDMDQMIIRAAFEDSALERTQPRSDGKPPLRQPILPVLTWAASCSAKPRQGV